MPVVVVSRKKIPLDPLSTKLAVYCTFLKVVMKFSELSSVKTDAVPSALFDCVPIPKTNAPVALGAPPDGTCGNSTITPLLSVAKSATGFCTCCVSGRNEGTQPVFGQA